MLTVARINDALANLDAWFETMRGPNGYGGPVAHWWQQSLIYTGAGLDWRYEGLITGYVQLWQRTGNEVWLMKARRAGDDLLSGQLEDDHFAASAFELNPATAGTPHEAACDCGLLHLALALQQLGEGDWEKYARCARRNVQGFYIGQLWDAESQSFSDSPRVPSFVPNKAATVCEALFLLTQVTKDARWVECYALPTLKRVIEHQVCSPGNLDGAIAQNSLGKRRVEKYFPLYIARCVPALVLGCRWTNEEHYVQCALRAMQFVVRWKYEDGSYPAVIYENQRLNRYPQWVAALGDILRAADELRPYGLDTDLTATEDRLLAGQDASGGIQTATGFAAQASGRLESIPDLRDALHVAGWCDKAFRYLASRAGPNIPLGQSSDFAATCTFRKQTVNLVETPQTVQVYSRQGVSYQWDKGKPWPTVASPEFWLH